MTFPIQHFDQIILPDGAVGSRLINKTGSPSVKGMIVGPCGSEDNAFIELGADDPDPVGVVWESGVADGDPCIVVTEGRVQALLVDTTTCARGNWARISATTAGRVDASLAAPPGGTITAIDNHFREIGHCMETIGVGGVDVLAWFMVHFN